MDDKWWAIGFALFLFCMGIAGVVDTYSKGQCRTEAVQRGMSVDDIAKACR